VVKNTMVSSTNGKGIPMSHDIAMKNMAASPARLSTLMEAASVESAPFIHSIIIRFRLLWHKMQTGTMLN
jgi:hypothetical protein